MGKSLIIKGADFSANGMPDVYPFDIASIIGNSSSYKVRLRLSGYMWSNTAVTANNRCCVIATLFSDWNIDITQYSEMEVKFKDGYKYILSTGKVPGQSSTSWQSWDGDGGGGGYDWGTGSIVNVILDETTLAMSMQLGKTDDSEMAADTKLTDIIDYIKLY